MKRSKSTLEYWRGRLQKRKFKRKGGDNYQGADYFIYLSVDGKQCRFPLDSSNKEIAAEKALEIWHFYKANGGQATLDKYKPNKPTPTADPSIGEFLSEIERLRLYKPRTFATYRRKLRRIVVGAMNIPSPPSKCDYVNGGYQEWVKKVDGVKLSKLTPVKILEWRAQYLTNAAPDAVSQKKAQVTVTSTIRNAKSLFKEETLKHLSFEKIHNPFAEIKAGTSTTRRYKSEIDFTTLASDALAELRNAEIPEIDEKNYRKSKTLHDVAISKPEQFKILLLSLGAGLRRGEIDTLEWSNIDFDNHQISVEDTEFGVVKSESSERIVDIDESVTKLLLDDKRRSTLPFVVNSKIATRPGATYYHYRCKKHFNGLVSWLRDKGISRTNALHELRKEYGSKVCDQFGIHAAGEALGHKTITVTKASYLEKKGRKAVSVF